MNRTLGIIRRGLVMVLAIAYILMSIAGAAHEITHHAHPGGNTGKVRSTSGASPLLLMKVSERNTAPQPLDSHPAGFCFFCTLASVSLLILVGFLLFGLRADAVRLFGFALQRWVASPQRRTISLRGPPACA